MNKALLSLAEKTRGRQIHSPTVVVPSRIKRILVVRQHDQLGDFLLSTPVFAALKGRFPGCYTGVVVRGYFGQVLEGHPYVDETITWKPTGGWSPGRLMSFWKSLRSGWDLAVVLNTVSHSLTSDLLADLSGAQWTVGSTGQVFPGAQRNFLYNIEVPLKPGRRHQTDRNLDIVRFLGADTSEKSPHMTLMPEEVKAGHDFFIGLGGDIRSRAVALHLGAGKPENRWPLDHFINLAYLLAHEEIQAVVTWGLKEKGLAEEFKARYHGKALYAGAPPLRALGALYRNLSAVVVNDTGMLHLAAACSVPLVGLFGPTDPADWCPLGPKFLSVRGSENRVANVTVDQVWERLKTLLT